MVLNQVRTTGFPTLWFHFNKLGAHFATIVRLHNAKVSSEEVEEDEKFYGFRSLWDWKKWAWLVLYDDAFPTQQCNRGRSVVVMCAVPFTEFWVMQPKKKDKMPKPVLVLPPIIRTLAGEIRTDKPTVTFQSRWHLDLTNNQLVQALAQRSLVDAGTLGLFNAL